MEPGGSGTAGSSSGGAGRRPFNFPGNNSSRNQQQNVGDSSAPSKSNPNLNKAQWTKIENFDSENFREKQELIICSH